MRSMSVTGWLRERHSLAVEGGLVVVLYALYQTSRGLVVGDPARAVHHAQMIASFERTLHVFVEGNVQHAAHSVPGVIGTFGVLYLTCHLAVTCAFLVWLHIRRPDAFPLVRTTFLIASGLALVGFLLFPTAPPRLAGLGIADTISHGGLDMDHGLVSSLYNPFAAFPSVHIAYAVVVGASLVRYGGRRILRVLGALYPVLVLLVIVATGNHFFTDAAGGAVVAAVAAASAAIVLAPTARVRLPVPAKA